MADPLNQIAEGSLHGELQILCAQALALLGLEPTTRSTVVGQVPLHDAASNSPLSASILAMPLAAGPSRVLPPRPAVQNVRRHETGTSLGAQVLPPPHQIPGEPFVLEPMSGPAPEAWSDLREILAKSKWGALKAPPSDQEARQIRDQWRPAAVCADLLLLGAQGMAESLHQRLVQAISVHICPAIWVDALLLRAQEAESYLLHPANRLLLISPEALALQSWLQTDLREDPQGTTWRGRPAVVLASANELEEDPSLKRVLWDGLQAWKRTS